MLKIKQSFSTPKLKKGLLSIYVIFSLTVSYTSMTVSENITWNRYTVITSYKASWKLYNIDNHGNGYLGMARCFNVHS